MKVPDLEFSIEVYYLNSIPVPDPLSFRVRVIGWDEVSLLTIVIKYGWIGALLGTVTAVLMDWKFWRHVFL